MLRTALLSLFLLVSLTTSTSIIRQKLFRRQADSSYCHAIDGFECKCSHYRVTCTNDRGFNTPITISQNEKDKYQSVELVISAAQDIEVNDRTFEPVKELYKSDADNAEFRLKFEGFTALRLASPGLLNRVFPDSLPSNARKHVALEIYNPTVAPHDDAHLFQNLQADSLELYALYPFTGTFQQMFDGANIKYLRLSGGDIRSDINQPFSGNIHRLELAKQADRLNVQNFPVYPAHEMIINAFYISHFNTDHPPNYDNLGELRVHSLNNIPANAFQQYPNIHTLSVHSDKEIDPHAFDGLNNLEKLIIKDSKTTMDHINNLPNVKEFETNIEKLDENLQCKLIEKLANGQVAVQAIPNGRECTCVSAYLDTAGGRNPCDAQDCDQSSCAAIKNNYDAATRQFTPPPPIRRSDGSDALRQREPRLYTAPFQISHKDQEKLNQGLPTSPPQQQTDDKDRRPNEDGTGQQDPDRPQDPYPPYVDYGEHKESTSSPSDKEEHNLDYQDIYGLTTTTRTDDLDDPNRHPDETYTTTIHNPLVDDQREEEGTSSVASGDGTDNTGADGTTDQNTVNGTDTSAPGKRRMSWLPIIIIIAAIVALLLIGLLFLLLRKRRAAKGYNQAATNEPKPDTAARA